MKKRLLIWDFDGTLVDTLTDVALCFNEALRRCGFPEHELEAFHGFVGGNLETVVSRMLPPDILSTENIDRVKNAYRNIYLAYDKPNTKPYDGIISLLQDCKMAKRELAIHSNKGQSLLDDMVKKLFPKGLFGAVIGYVEQLPSKPAPDGVYSICKVCGCSVDEAVYIGDGRSDIETAVNAGIPCVLVRWGQGTEQDWQDSRVSHCVRNVGELRRILNVDRG